LAPAKRDVLLLPHFMDDATRALLLGAFEDLSDIEAADVYQQFTTAREDAMIREIRRVCGITSVRTVTSEDTRPDDLAEDVKANVSTLEDEIADYELDIA
jgi:hypothetical protein